MFMTLNWVTNHPISALLGILNIKGLLATCCIAYTKTKPFKCKVVEPPHFSPRYNLFFNFKLDLNWLGYKKLSKI